MIKKLSIFGLLIILIIGLIFVAQKVKYKSQRNKDSIWTKLHVILFNDNNINIQVKNTTDSQKIKIAAKNIIFENGNIIGKIKNRYGMVKLSFYENDVILLKLVILKQIGGTHMIIIFTST